MKTLRIKISDTTNPHREIARFRSIVPEPVEDSPEFMAARRQIIACIEDFSGKVKKLAKSGTTIHARKEFFLPRTRVVIVLEYPRKRGFWEKLLEAARGKLFLSKSAA